MLLTAALIFGLLARNARTISLGRLARVYGEQRSFRRLGALVRRHPDRNEMFRWRVLPWIGLQLGFDVASCATFITAVFTFPPSKFGPTDLAVLQKGSVVIVLTALVIDLLFFIRALVATFEARRLGGQAEERQR
jgi:hypothetical protein